MMFAKRCVVTGLSLIVALVSVLAACAAPTPTPTPTPTLTPNPTSTPTPGPLAQIITGAKKEGTVTAVLRSTLTPKSIERLRKEIKEKFGVDLDIKFTPSAKMTKALAEAIMEYQAGATPTYELMTFASHVVQANQAGILEQVDWKPLLTQDTNPEVVMEQPALYGAIVNYTGFMGLMYNPEKVPMAQVPQTLSDLGDARWKGRVAVPTSGGDWVRWAYILGKEKVIADLRGILRNKAIQGMYTDMYNRYLLGEVWMCFVGSVYLKMAEEKGMPTAWQHLDFAEREDYSLVVRKGAAHPNAAKLVAIYLATPSGAKFMLEESGSGNLYYAGNFEHDLWAQAKSQGIPEILSTRNLEWLGFAASEEYTQWENEFNLILKTGG